MLKVLDGDVVHVAPVPYTMTSGEDASLVELEWTGRRGTLEGGGSRGAHATSADAALIGVTASGVRRLYLVECKYTEVYTTSGDAKGTGDAADVRRARYANRYASSDSCLSGAAPLDAVLYEPFYQIVRLGMLADAARQDVGMHVDETRVVVLCPEGNAEYRTRITSPALASQFGKHTVEYIAAQLWRDPRGFRMADPGELAAAARQAGGDAVGTWSAYLAARYGW